MIKPDWLHSASLLRFVWNYSLCVAEEQTASPRWKQRRHEMLLKWLGIFSEKRISVCGHGFCAADDVSRGGVGEWRDRWQEREKVRAMRDIMCLWLLCSPPHSHPHPHCFSPSPGAGTFIWFPGSVPRRPHIEPRYCGFIKIFPPLSWCVWLRVFLSACVCFCHRVLLLFYNRVNITTIRNYFCGRTHRAILTLHLLDPPDPYLIKY